MKRKQVLDMMQQLGRLKACMDRVFYQDKLVTEFEYKLERLPLFGKKVDPSRLTFNWPKTMGLLKGDLNELKLARLFTVKSRYEEPDICDMMVQLSDGRQSPLLSQENSRALKDVVELDQSKTVTSVKVRVNKEEDEVYINEIVFTYSDNTTDQTPQYSDQGQLLEQKIADGKRIVGIYGKLDQERVVSLGFVLLVPV